MRTYSDILTCCRNWRFLLSASTHHYCCWNLRKPRKLKMGRDVKIPRLHSTLKNLLIHFEINDSSELPVSSCQLVSTNSSCNPFFFREVYRATSRVQFPHVAFGRRKPEELFRISCKRRVSSFTVSSLAK